MPMDPVSIEVDDSSQEEEDSIPFLDMEVGRPVDIQILKQIPLIGIPVSHFPFLKFICK